MSVSLPWLASLLFSTCMHAVDIGGISATVDDPSLDGVLAISYLQTKN
jgi:hypothetical protein